MTKIFYGNQYVESFNCDGRRTTWLERFTYKAGMVTKRVIMTAGAFSVIGWTYLAGSTFTTPITVYAEKEVVKEVKGHSPVMDRIAMCESGGSHISKKTGQITMRANTNNTVDLGKYQINSIWSKKATELGLDITKEVDNEKMAYWIYENRGTGDWYSSQDCWKR